MKFEFQLKFKIKCGHQYKESQLAKPATEPVSITINCSSLQKNCGLADGPAVQGAGIPSTDPAHLPARTGWAGPPSSTLGAGDKAPLSVRGKSATEPASISIDCISQHR